MTDLKISAFLVTLNESNTIAEAIKSVIELDEVIVVDSGSSDGTIEIAESLGAKVIHQEWLGFAKQKSFALEQCRNEWCINLDGDETIPLTTLTEIKTLIGTSTCDTIRIPIEDYVLGAPMHRLSRKRSIVRAFKKSMVSYPLDRMVHENIVSTGIEATISSRIIHYGYDDLYTFMEKQNKYARLSALSKFQKGKKASISKLSLVFIFTFIKVYFFRRLFLSGARGLIQSTIEAMYAFLKESYLYAENRKQKNIIK
ncbi:MAG: glycosyltransferase family 2 protein [Agarilytica sp.]